MRYSKLSACICFIVLAAGLVACGTKKNTPLSRQWQAFNTRYNVYFNGEEHYKETLKDLEKDYEDDYSRQVLMHPVEAYGDLKLPQPSGDFTRTIEKMQKAIQLHSITRKPAKRTGSAKDRAFRAREEFNPFLHNAWLMMGRAQYYNGDFLGAASTFLYITKHFFWLPQVVTEAALWQARCYCALNWIYETQNILHTVKEKDLTSKSLLNLYNFVQADYLIRANQPKEAIPFLQQAAQAASGSQKNRLYFLLGQIYEDAGEKANAYEAFKKAGAGPSTPYRTKFNARIKQSEVFAGPNIKSEVRSLKALTRFERNREYFDQIYYAIGNLYLSAKDSANAKENYLLAIKNSKRQGIDMAMAQLALANIYFAERKYVDAQPYYAAALPLISDNYPNYKLLLRRSDVLDELALYAGNVILQDSLLDLSKLSPEEQLKAAERLVAELVKQEKLAKEEAEREEFLAEQSSANTPMNNNASSIPGFQNNNDQSWYFYNNFTKNAGKTEFQRRWGSRRLEDDWRRRNKSSFSFEEETDLENQDELGALEAVAANDSVPAPDSEIVMKESDPHYVEYYLKQIPNTEEEKEVCNDVIQEGLYNMGTILKDKLEDYPAARYEFNRLLTRYPDNVYKLDVYYDLYLMAARENDMATAETWRQKILQEFPLSKYGLAMQDPDYFRHLQEMHQVQETMYEKAYAAYLDNDNKVVHTLADEMEAKYPLSDLLPKFYFINALAYFTEGDYDQFKDNLTTLLERWPDTDMTETAASFLKGLREGRTLYNSGENSRGMIWNIRLTDSEEQMLDDEGLPQFENDPDSPQYFVLAFPRDEVNANMVLYEVARFNFSSFIVRDFDLEQMSFSNIGLLIVKGFRNLKDLERYRSVFEGGGIDLPPQVVPIMISKNNFELLLKQGRTFEDYFRFMEEAVTDEVEAEVLEQTEDQPQEEVEEIPQEPVEESPHDQEEETPQIQEEETLQEPVEEAPQEQEIEQPQE